MSHTDGELAKKLALAAEWVEIGDKYRHYKGADMVYTVLNFAILESTEEVVVVYQAEYGERLVWVRTLEDFLAEVETGGKKMKRFAKV